MGNKIYKWIDLSGLPVYEKGAYKDKINWYESARLHSKVKFVYKDVSGYVKIIDYNEGYLVISYNNKTLRIHTSNFANCGLGKILGKITNEFKFQVGQVVKDDKRDIVITHKKYIKDKNGKSYKAYKFICNKCGFSCGEHYLKGELQDEYWMTESNLNRNGCTCCANQITVPHINSIVANKETHWMIPYFQGGYDEAKKYAPQSNRKIFFKCPDCNNPKDKGMIISDMYINRSISCPNCSDGFKYPEKFMYSILKQLDIDFETQYSPKYLKLNNRQKRSDFYVSSMKLIIETDGSLGHKGGRTHGCSKKTLEECIEVDQWKDEQHKLHGLHTVRINCFKSNCEYIKNNILNSELVDYFNFENIDWNKANNFAWFSNFKKEVCEYWNIKEDWESVVSLSKKFNIGRTSTLNYLNRGTKLGWCNYNGKEEVAKSSSKIGKMRGKPVEIFKDNISLGVFPSTSELQRQSFELFGVLLSHTAISGVAIGKRKSHKGFTFRYVNEVESQPNPNQTQSA